MASRNSTRALPKRAGETFARIHHGKKTDFDLRNPTALALTAEDDDDEDGNDLLAADLGGSATIKRGAVNIDGYDSDSDNDNINVQADERAKRRKKRKGDNWDLGAQMDNYKAGAEEDGDSKKTNDDADADADADADDLDMFAEQPDEKDDANPAASGGAKKAVRFLDADEIDNQEASSKNRTRIRLDDEPESSGDEEDARLAVHEEGLDDEVGLGGSKVNAPKVEAFNIRKEMSEGKFDQDGNFVRNATDPNARYDNWLEGTGSKDMRKAAAAHEKRQAEAVQKLLQDDDVRVRDLLDALISRLERSETVLEALARLGRQRKQQPKQKKIAQWKLEKMAKADGMNVDDAKHHDDPEQKRVKEDIASVTEAADKLLSRDYPDIYDHERELLIRAYRRETGEDWKSPPKPQADEPVPEARTWEFRWTDGRDNGTKQGPYDSAVMKAWQDAGYFGEGVEFRRVEEDDWARLASFD